MIRNRSVSHVHIDISIIFTSIITNSDHFWTLLVRYFTCNCHSPISKSLLIVKNAWVTFCPISSHLPRNYFVLVWPLLLLFNQPFILYPFPFSFFESTLYFTFFFSGTSHILVLHRFYRRVATSNNHGYKFTFLFI